MSRVLGFESEEENGVKGDKKNDADDNAPKVALLQDNNGDSKLARIARSCINAFNQHVRDRFPEVSFITLHYTYFIGTSLISAIIFWGSSTPAKSVRFIDSVFLTTSAMTEAGLNTVNLSELNTWQQVMLFLLIIMGSAIFVSSAVIHVRKRAFETRLQDLADRRQKRLLRPRSLTFTFTRRTRNANQHEAEVASGAVRGRAIQDPPANIMREPEPPQVAPIFSHEESSEQVVEEPQPLSGGHIRFDDNTNLPPLTRGISRSDTRGLGRILSNTGVGAHRMHNHPRNAVPYSKLPDLEGDYSDTKLQTTPIKSGLAKYIDSVNGLVGPNSQFHQLTEKERRNLGGIEYDSLCVLSYVVPIYFILFQLFGAIGCGAWMQINQPNTAEANGLNPFWTGAFFAISAFNNSGMALLDANATVFQKSYYMLLTLSLLILAGNTCFPPFLRLILWTMKKCIPKDTPSPRWSRWRNVLAFILEHPRRVYTNLFPSVQTWWLVFSLIALNGIDWLAFEVLNIGNPTLDTIPARFRAIDGLFQAFAVRCGGFYVVAIANLYPGTLVLYVLMMYLSAFPVTVAIRNTNVYEERSLAIFSEDLPEQQHQASKDGLKKSRSDLTPFGMVRTLTGQALSLHQRAGTTQKHTLNDGWSRQDFIRQQLRSQLSHDLWWISLAILFITIIETSQFHRDPVNFSIFNIIFEVVSAYGTVGISVGVPWAAYSFSGAWHTGSKLILCAVMLRGRHRGLPVAIDRAVLLPSSSLAWAEEEDGRRRQHHNHNQRVRTTSSIRGGGDFNNNNNDSTAMSRQTTRRLSSGQSIVRKRKSETNAEDDEGAAQEKQLQSRGIEEAV